jgi:hypothetical protein
MHYIYIYIYLKHSTRQRRGADSTRHFEEAKNASGETFVFTQRNVIINRIPEEDHECLSRSYATQTHVGFPKDRTLSFIKLDHEYRSKES